MSAADVSVEALSQKLEDNCNIEIEGSVSEIINNFNDLDVSSEILKGIFAYGFKRPSPIQSRAIRPCIEGKDVIAQAQSGTGKTATFVIAALAKIDVNKSPVKPQALVLCPTRELAQQIHDVFCAIGKYTNVVSHVCIGGTMVREDINKLENGVHVVVGTPGRIFHMIDKGHLQISDLGIFILDEADEMLSRGFKDQIHMIFIKLPEQIQVILLSATIPEAVMTVTDKFMRNPVRISVKKEQLTLSGINQYFICVESKDVKVDAIIDILGATELPQIVIFANSHRDVDILNHVLTENKFSVACIHASMEQSKREEVMKGFRKGDTRIMITTNLISRGIDVQSVSLVINFQLPSEYESYIHRIGRSGRYGRRGVAVNLVTPEEVGLLQEIQNFYHTEIKEMPRDMSRVL